MTGKPKKVLAGQNGQKLKPLTIAASAEEVARWKERAKAENRSLSQWIRLRLAESCSVADELAARALERADRT